MASKLARKAEKGWRKLIGSAKLQDVIDGIVFVTANGQLDRSDGDLGIVRMVELAQRYPGVATEDSLILHRKRWGKVVSQRWTGGGRTA